MKSHHFSTKRCLALSVLICGLSLFDPECAHADLVNRWSFNNASGAASNGTSLADSISSAAAVVTGTGASFTGTALRQ